MSKDLCRRFIDFFNSNPQYHIEGRSGDGVYHNQLKDTEIAFYFSKYFIDVVKDLIPYIKGITDEYEKINPYLKELPTWNVDDNFQMSKYEPGQVYSGIHCEHGPMQYNQSRRIIAWMIYLNDVYDGGGTHFPQYNYTTKARTGTIALWPSGWTHMHRGEVSNTEKKYILTGWYQYLK